VERPIACRCPAWGVLLGVAALAGCQHAWDDYDPGAAGSTAAGSGGVGGAGVASGAGAGASSSSSSASSAAASNGGAGGSTGTGAGGGGEPCPAPLFTDDFSGDLRAWTVDGGTWAIDAGALEQQDETASAALIYVPGFADLADQRLQATTTAVSGDVGGALELAARIDPANPGNRYWCGFQPADGYLIVRVDANYLKVNDPIAFQVDLSQTPNYDPAASHTLHFELQGTTLHCWVEGVVGADATTSDGTYTQGLFGLKTYLQRARFDDMAVCP
jgi:hypothetical protein